MSNRTVIHHTFTIDRTYNATPARVFKAWADPASKRRWFVEGEGWEVEKFEADFRVGGHEVSTFRFKGGPLVRNDTHYQDIVSDQRIVSVYSMVVAEKRISSSLATIEILPSANATRLIYTEQAAFFDGVDQPKNREIGCRELLDKLAEELQKTA